MSETTLSREAIVAEAIRIADADGLEKVTMRRIATALGAGAMSLYRHIPDKETLIQEMAAVVGEQHAYPAGMYGEPNWRARVHVAAESDMRLYLHHPWVLLAHTVPRAAMAASSVSCFDWLVEALRHLTGDVVTAAEFALLVWNHVQGAGLGAVGALLVAPGISLEGAGFIAGLAENPIVAELPILNELVQVQRANLNQVAPLLTAGIEALCDGFEVRLRAR